MSSARPKKTLKSKDKRREKGKEKEKVRDKIPANHLVHGGEFDWDKLHNKDDLELWIIRVPEALAKPKILESLSLDKPTSSKRTARIGAIQRKHTSYDVWSIGDELNEYVGGDEVKSLEPLLPQSSKGNKLYLAPEMKTRHMVITARPAIPTPEPSPEGDPTTSTSKVHRNPPRFTYPKEVLKHAFVPTGALTRIPTPPPSPPRQPEPSVLDVPPPVHGPPPFGTTLLYPDITTPTNVKPEIKLDPSIFDDQMDIDIKPVTSPIKVHKSPKRPRPEEPQLEPQADSEIEEIKTVQKRKGKKDKGKTRAKVKEEKKDGEVKVKAERATSVAGTSKKRKVESVSPEKSKITRKAAW
ncbi:hypothetical protein NLI96_g2757 [Meripilus lineatus]|uniref:Uncharacterized protein n=1 Tax=Meripilus lineatus TaxID=2056292 RepID=A0AAD5YGB0_9APHY|nr:hypothetical protein NLI96_g2757 [Physisporinus lineatus]